MPYCSILECKNDSSRKNLKKGGVSYHRLPKDASIKEKWIDATGRVNWMPSNCSSICSEHFLEEDFIISNKGLRYIKPTAIPSIKIVKFIDQQQNVNVDTAGPSERQSDSESFDSSSLSSSSSTSQPKKKGLIQTEFVDMQKVDGKEDDVITGQFYSENSLVQFKSEPDENIKVPDGFHCSISRENKLEAQLRFCKNKIVKQGLKIKRLQSKNRRLEKKINELLSR